MTKEFNTGWFEWWIKILRQVPHKFKLQTPVWSSLIGHWMVENCYTGLSWSQSDPWTVTGGAVKFPDYKQSLKLTQFAAEMWLTVSFRCCLMMANGNKEHLWNNCIEGKRNEEHDGYKLNGCCVICLSGLFCMQLQRSWYFHIRFTLPHHCTEKLMSAFLSLL